MGYTIEPRDRTFVKGYGFLSFAENIGAHLAKVAKNVSNKYIQKLLNAKRCYNRCK